jgi:hypothetical protein
MNDRRSPDIPRGKKRLLASAALLVASVSLSVVVLEWILEDYAPKIRTYSEIFTGPKMPFTSSPYLPATTPKSRTFHHKTDEFDVAYHFNEYGYRGQFPRQLEKAAGIRRILVLGDSYTLGWGNDLEDTFVQMIADNLRVDDYEVINAGYRGYIAPDAYYAYLLKEGLLLEPDVVIVVLFSGNDITEMRDNLWFSLDARRMPLQLSTTRLYTDYDGNFLFPPGSRDKLVGWNYRVPVLRESRAFIGVTELINKVISPRPPYHPRLTLFGKLREPQPVEEGWRRFKLSIESLNELGRNRGVKMVYALIPPSPQRWKEDSGQTLNRMRNIVVGSGAWLLGFQSQLTNEHYYTEGHLNETGNEVFAQQMIGFLKETPTLLETAAED